MVVVAEHFITPKSPKVLPSDIHKRKGGEGNIEPDEVKPITQNDEVQTSAQ